MVPHSAIHQRGAIGLMAALTLGLALLFMLLVVDSGRLYLEQRKLQRIADMAALEAAGQNAVCTGTGPQATTIARTAATRNGHDAGNPLVASCGYVQTGADQLRAFTVDASRNEAIKVEVRKTVPTSVAGGVYSLVKNSDLSMNTILGASAVAARLGEPQAMLSIKTTLASVDSNQSILLNSLLRELGSTVQLDVLSWNNIAGPKINLLQYFKQAILEIDSNIGSPQELLNTNAKMSKLLKAAVRIMQQNGELISITDDMNDMAESLDHLYVKLGDTLAIQNGTSQAGLDTNVQVLQLLQSMLMASDGARAAVLNLSSGIPGLINANVRVQIVEPPQFSAVGNPETDEIKVHTAQARALISLDLPILNTIAGLVNAVAGLASPLTSAINSLLHLNLLDALQGLTCILSQCKYTDIRIVENLVSLDIGIEVAKAGSNVTDYRCRPSKSLTALTSDSAAIVSIGKFKDPAAFFNQGSVTLTPLPLIDIGIKTCGPLGMNCTRKAFAAGGIGLKLKAPILESQTAPLTFTGNLQLPKIGDTPYYLSTAIKDPIASLSNTTTGLQLQAFEPTVDSGLGDALTLTAGILDTVRTIVEPIIKGLLSPLIDPLVNALLKVLGIDLAKAEVGANLTCSSGHAQLVL
ncbi:pilus assembly protein TadG-related protein [Pseudomonas putida]|uniref:pilus assembly protein TadG-related protein n=1 Tax=Pseudomonas putida TaxID=303 RepID=UPI002D1EDC3E|nr:pilus assembly protein TadG-related protein [Pseudomonas putida]MEB3901477.1 pilus assembly protein TadG-related protein [Pseudomonas putida]